jgi:DNA-binding MarR family transcriptional regulator
MAAGQSDPPSHGAPQAKAPAAKTHAAAASAAAAKAQAAAASAAAAKAQAAEASAPAGKAPVPEASAPAAKTPTPGTRPPASSPAGPSPELTDLGLAFRHLFRAVSRMRGRDTHLAGAEISHAQFELLIELDERGELSAGELAVAARLSPATVTQMLDGLAESGHVERTRSESDRRVVLARLTPLGRARVEVKRALWRQRWEQALADVSPREIKAATKVLRRLGEMFAEEVPSAGCEGLHEGAAEPPAAGRKPAQ